MHNSPKASGCGLRTHNLTTISAAVNRGLVSSDTFRVDECGMIHLADADEKESSQSPKTTPANDCAFRLKSIIDKFVVEHRLPLPLRMAQHTLVADDMATSIDKWWHTLDSVVYALLSIIIELSGTAYDLRKRGSVRKGELPGIFHLLGYLDGVEGPDRSAFSRDSKLIAMALEKGAEGQSSELVTGAALCLREFLEPRRNVAVELARLDMEIRKGLGKPWEELQAAVDTAANEDDRSESHRVRYPHDAIALVCKVDSHTISA